MSEYRTFTHRFNINDVGLLLEEAKDIESYAQLRERAVEVLSQPSRARRTEIAGDVKRFLLDYGEKDLNPSKLPLVRLWNAIADSKTRRELLYTDFMNHVKTMDSFVKEILYPKVSKASNDLLRSEYTEINREEVDNFLNSKLEKHTPSSFRKTRNHLLGMLGEFGILQGKGSDFSSAWTVRRYEPTLIGWLYGIYREFDHISERKRSETYFTDESPTTRRFLLSSGELRYLIGKALEENHLDKEIFGGVPVYRLPQPDTDTFVEVFING